MGHQKKAWHEERSLKITKQLYGLMSSSTETQVFSSFLDIGCWILQDALLETLFSLNKT